MVITASMTGRHSLGAEAGDEEFYVSSGTMLTSHIFFFAPLERAKGATTNHETIHFEN